MRLILTHLLSILLGDSMLITLKKLVKPLEIPILGWATCAKMGSVWVTPKTKTFFAEITKADYKLTRTFYFIKISYVLAEL